MTALSRFPLSEPLAAPPVAVIGVPFGAGAGLAGCEFAPAALRQAGLASRIGAAGRFVAHDRDVAFAQQLALLSAHAPARNVGAVATALRATHEATFAALSRGEAPLIVGGDHSISMGSVSAASRHARRQGKRAGLLWIDAHADFNTPETSPSGNLHGMSIAYLLGETSLHHLGGNLPLAPLRAEDVVILGLRSVDAGEEARLKRAGIRHITPDEIDRRGMEAVMAEILARFPAEETELHVSLDIDSIDPETAPGVGTPVEAGLTVDEVVMVAETLARAGRIASADLVELNPTRDPDGRTTALALRLVEALVLAPVSHQPA